LLEINKMERVINRRDFLRLVAVATAGTALSGCLPPKREGDQTIFDMAQTRASEAGNALATAESKMTTLEAQSATSTPAPTATAQKDLPTIEIQLPEPTATSVQRPSATETPTGFKWLVPDR